MTTLDERIPWLLVAVGVALWMLVRRLPRAVLNAVAVCALGTLAGTLLGWWLPGTPQAGALAGAVTVLAAVELVAPLWKLRHRATRWLRALRAKS